MNSAPSLLDIALLVASFMVWALSFAILYGVQGAGCALDWDDVMAGPISALRWALLILWVGHLAVGAALIAWTARRRRAGQTDLFRGGAFALSVMAFVAIFGAGAPVLFLTQCG